MNYPLIFKLLSLIFAIMAGAFAACFCVCLWYGAKVFEAEALPAWITCMAIAMFFAACFYYPNRDASKKLYKKEALCVVGLGWLASALLGAMPYLLILDCSFADAFFESSSGLTTTGASVFSDLNVIPKSLLFWRCFTQWIGGMGVVIFFVAILSFLGAGGKIIYTHEMGTNPSETDSSRIQVGVLRIIYLYLAISAICFVAFKLVGMDYYDALCHMFATVSTGGFSVYSNSIAHYNSPLIEWTVTLFMFIGGINFSVILMFVMGKFRAVLRNTELRWYVGILCFSTLSIASVLINADALSFSNVNYAIRTSAFQVVSIMTSTGFMTADYCLWVPLAHVILFCLMFIGGCSGSTSGGLKVIRVVVAFKMSLVGIEKSFRTHVVRIMRLNGQPLDVLLMASAMSFIMLYMFTTIFGVLSISLIERNVSFAGCLSAVVTCISNIGPGLAEVGPASSYGFLAQPSKLILSLLMIMGRLEFYAILALFMPSLWKKFQ